GNTHAHRPLAWQPGNGHESAHPLRDLIVAGTVSIRTALAEAGDRAVHQTRIDFGQGLVVDAEPLLDVGPEVLDDDVGARGDLFDDLDPARVLEVERHRPLVPV